MKGRFQSLKELRIQINSQKRHQFANLWIICCIILHNLIIRIEDCSNRLDPQEFRDLIAEGGQEDHVDDLQGATFTVGSTSTGSPGQLFREQVMTALFDSHLSPVVRRS